MKMQRQLFDKKMRDLEPEVWSLARQNELGELRGMYHALQHIPLITVLGIIFLAFGVGVVVCAIIFLSFLAASLVALLALPALFFLGMGSLMLSLRRVYASWHVSVWEAGFLYQRRSLREVFRWDQIDSIQGSISYQQNQAVLAYKVRRQDGYEIRLDDNFADITQLVDQILASFSRQATSDNVSILPPGDRTFTNFKLDRQGLSDPRGALPWREIQELSINKGTMAVFLRQPD